MRVGFWPLLHRRHFSSLTILLEILGTLISEEETEFFCLVNNTLRPYNTTLSFPVCADHWDHRTLTLVFRICTLNRGKERTAVNHSIIYVGVIPPHAQLDAVAMLCRFTRWRPSLSPAPQL